ncbi:MAG: hypothetical protein ABIQ30_07680 [Devosia sp.]
MSDPANTTETPPSGDWRAQKRAEKHARRQARHEMTGETWAGIPMAGVLVIVVGLVFLLGNFGLHLPPRWWAIFILVPAAAALVSAVRLHSIDGRFSSRVTGAATAGALMLAVALILFLDLSWNLGWPVLVIIVGLGIVARGTRNRL